MKLFIEIVFNLGMIALLSILACLIGADHHKNQERKILRGLLFGAGAIIGMLMPAQLYPGIHFDGRSVLISFSGLFFGPISALVATIMVIAFRIYQGGAGTFAGSLVALSSAGWGILFFSFIKHKKVVITPLLLLNFGLLVQVSMILLLFLLPSDLAWRTIQQMIFPSLTVYPATTVLIGCILNLILSRYHVAEELKKSEALYRSILFASPDNITITDADGIVKMCSPVAFPLFQCEQESEIMGQKIDKFIIPEERDRLREKINEMLKGSCLNAEEFKGKSCKGRPIDLEINGKAIRDAQHKVQYIVLIIRDITEKAQIKKQMIQMNEELDQRVKIRTSELEEMNKALRAFSYSVSHDLRAPLRAINGFSNIIMDDYSEALGEEGSRMLSIIKDNAVRMDELIKGLLFMSKVTQSEIKKQRIDCNELVSQCIKELMQTRDSNLIQIQVDDLPEAFGDPVLIRQVWLNLIENALKFSKTREQVKIKISGFKKDQWVEYGVRDNGVGFDEQYKDKLFKTFERLHGDDEFKGTGIGLALVERIVNRHGGNVRAEGEQNMGARFFFSLPLPL